MGALARVGAGVVLGKIRLAGSKLHANVALHTSVVVVVATDHVSRG